MQLQNIMCINAVRTSAKARTNQSKPAQNLGKVIYIDTREEVKQLAKHIKAPKAFIPLKDSDFKISSNYATDGLNEKAKHTPDIQEAADQAVNDIYDMAALYNRYRLMLVKG